MKRVKPNSAPRIAAITTLLHAAEYLRNRSITADFTDRRAARTCERHALLTLGAHLFWTTGQHIDRNAAGELTLHYDTIFPARSAQEARHA